MKRLLIGLGLGMVLSVAQAGEYGHYNLKRLTQVTSTPAGKQYSLDVGYLDGVVNDLAQHAGNYPPSFDSPADLARARIDARQLSGILEIVSSGTNAPAPLLMRAAMLNTLAHNLDVPGAASRADRFFKRLLALSPQNPEVNARFGTFLASSGRAREALPYLQTAIANGSNAAQFTTGMVYLSMGDQRKALQYLRTYQKNTPGDRQVGQIISSIQQGKVSINQAPTPR